MAIQYYMRAYNHNLGHYVDWAVNDTPDSTGQYSGYPIGDLINITVNRVVQSKVDNFLKPNQSLGGTDGNFFHVNSYDWKNATAPLLPPSSLTGVAVERGLAAVVSVSAAPGGASNTSPITITTSSVHGLVTGQIVTIIGVTGNTNANGTWPIVVTGATTFTLTGSTGNGVQTTGGGVVYVPTDMSVLAWDETNQIWRFFFNTNGDGTTVGASQSVKVNNFLMDGYLAIGPDPADTGAIRLSNDTYIFSEANPSGTDIQLIGGDSLNRIKLGNLTTDIVYAPGVVVVDGYIQHDGTGSNTAQTTGFIREKNATNIIAFRGSGGLAGSDIVALGSNSSNNVVLGDSVNTGILYETSTGNIHQFQVNNNPVFEIGTSFARFPSAVSAPFINQTVASAGSGQTLTIQAQQGAPGANAGGILQLASGNLGAGGTVSGTVDIYTGTIGASNLKMRVFPTTAASASDNNSIKYFENLFRVDAAQVNPVFRQDAQTTVASGSSYTIQAQDATLGSPSSGGNLVLLTGKGSDVTGLKDGYLFVQTGVGATTQIVVSPVNFPSMQYPTTTGKVVITGDLEVQGTTTTVDSTIVDIVGPIIHGNWVDPVTSGNVAIPATNVGYSIHRGNIGGAPSVPRDGAAWIWAEPRDLDSGADGYWHAITIPGDGAGADQNFSLFNSTNAVGVMALDFASTSDPNPISGYLASVGGLRTANNVISVAARNISTTTTVASTSNLVDLAAIPSNTLNVTSTTGFTTSGTILIFSDAGPQTLTYANLTGTTFTGVSAGAGIIHTGNYIAQTNKSTTVAAGSNGVSLPTGTINVVSNVGFPPSGTLRIVSHVTAGSGTASSVQNVNYTALSGTTQFTGCTGGTGTLFTGGTVTSLPVPGTQDITIVGTDFGNRIVYGSAAVNTGHIFNTTTGGFYDFQVNSVSQVQLGNADVDASGFFETIQISPTVSNPRLVQKTRPDTGVNNGFNLGVFAQSGQQQSGGSANNNGGQLFLVSGAQGTGGSGAAGIDGYVELRTGFTTKARFFPTFALSATDNNSVLYFENLFRVDTAQLTPRYRQDDVITASATGQPYTVQAQNATGTTSNGGALVLTSGTGTSVAGNVQLQTGAVDRIIVHPTFTEFRDAAEALRITPVSDGTTQITFAATDTAAQINQTLTASTPSAPMTVQSQVTNAASGQGGNLNLIAGNATGTTSTGGNAILTSGTGTTVAGNTQLQTGGVDRVIVHPTFTEFRDAAEALRITPVSAGTTHITFASTDTAASIDQSDTAGATGANMTMQAQNATTTGGNAVITSGTGATAGNIQLQTGAVDRVIVHPTFTEFRDTAEAYRVTPVSGGTTTLQLASTVTAAKIFQADLTSASGTGATLTVQAQNETGTTSTGGDLTLTSGTGTSTNGYINLQAGGSTTARVHSNKFIFSKGVRRNITNVSTTYQVLATDDYIAAHTSTAYTATLPLSPTRGDSYTFKDVTGGAGTNTLTISGNGTNIDGSASIVLNQAYAAVTLTYTGSQWSIT